MPNFASLASNMNHNHCELLDCNQIMLPRQRNVHTLGNILYLQNLLRRCQKSVKLGRMETPVSVPPVKPIRERIAELLTQLGQTPGWLAERAKVERSTVKRIIDGDRYPTADTLALLAPILGVTVEELVHGTDAADRIETARKLIDRTHYEEAVRQFIAMEQRATDLSRRLRETEESAANEHKKWSKTEKALESIKAELEETRQEARDHHQDAQRYKAALEQALTDLANLKTRAEELRLEVEKLGGQVGSNNVLTGIATFCAATAAALSLNSYLKDEPNPSNTARSRKKKKRTDST